MCLTQISYENKIKEEEIQKKIFSLIDEKKSLIFNSGAGSGKTYALIESLKYIINNYGKQLQNHNQKIVCITYTNVATLEVKERLGSTDLVLVSTIHTRIWDIIKWYKKKELLQIHKDKLIDEINSLEAVLESDKCDAYKDLSPENKKKFFDLVKENKELYYSTRNSNAAQTRSTFGELLTDFNNILNNIGKFKKTVDTLFKLDRYNFAVKCIEEKKEGYREVEYTDNYNLDRLDKMKISHDTLLEYGHKIIKEYDILKKIIIDQYPYLLVDEYQDTNPYVIEILILLMQHSKKIRHEFFVSFYGDKAQNIYNTGADDTLFEYEAMFEIVDKPFNRRSTQEVITTINKIRDDDIEQTSIYDDCGGGLVEFYRGEDVVSFIDSCKKEWEINLGNKLYCFVLTNETVAQYSGFANVYNSFKNCGRYKVGVGYQQITTETLNDDLTKLGAAQLQVFKIIYLHMSINNNKTSLNKTFISKNVYTNLNFKQLRSLSEELLGICGSTLGDYIEALLSKTSEDSVSNHYKILLDELFDIDVTSLSDFKQYLVNELVGSEERREETNDSIENLLNCSIDELGKWANYIMRKWNDKDIVYLTYHGTKGLEFDNVLIIMGNSFGKETDYFSKFFRNIDSHNQTTAARNLLYVACSRAIKNLRILYVDNVDGFRANIERIFGEIQNI